MPRTFTDVFSEFSARKHWRVRSPHRRKVLWSRYDCYKSHAHARRSFYKWVCKHELFGNLKIIHDEYGMFMYRDYPKYTFGGNYPRGYPTFTAGRSEARKQWENEFYADHYTRADKAAVAKLERVKGEIADREWATAAKRMKKMSTFFRVVAGVPALAGKAPSVH